MTKRPKLVKTPLAIPRELAEWVDAEARSKGMSRNSFLSFQIQLMRQTGHMERLRRLESRVAELERKHSPGAI